MKLDFKFIGWNQENPSDKIWGYFCRSNSENNTNYQNKEGCVFYGRRGKVLQLKPCVTSFLLDVLVKGKLDKGYKPIIYDRLLVIWPNFMECLEPKLMIEILSGRLK